MAIIIVIIRKTDLSCRMPKLQGQVTKSIKQYNNGLKKGKCSYGLNDKLNRCVFKCFLKVGSVLAEVTHAGRPFHRRGAATPKARYIQPLTVATCA